MAFDYFSITDTSLTEERKKEIVKSQSEILYELYFSKGSLASIDNQFGSEGLKVTRYISLNTVIYLNLVYVIPGFIFLLVSSTLISQSNVPVFIYIGLVFFSFPLWWFLPIWLIPKKEKNNVQDWIEKNLGGKRTGRFKIWKRLVTISPFSIKTIWMWVIIFGLFAAYAEVDFNQAITYAVLNKFEISFLRTMIVAVVSFIATNIITDLIALKDEYIKGKEKVSQLTKDISVSADNLKNDINASNTLIKDITSQIKNQKFFAPLQKEYDSFQRVKSEKYNPSSERLNKSFEQYSELLSKQIGILGSRLTGNPVIDLWILTGLKSAAELRVTQLQNENSMTTLFEVFGNIIADCLENFDASDDKNQTEVYTVFALPPDRYLNYNGNDPLSKNWKEYLDKNIEAAKQGVAIHRHFLSFKNSSQQIEALAGEEGKELGHEEVRQKWNEKYWVNNDGTPFYNETISRYQKSNETTGRTDLISKPLFEILSSTYHCPNCCKLIEVDLTKNWKDILYSEKYKKPVDYFALKTKDKGDKKGEWIFCFKTYYDKGFNAAIVEFWHDFHAEDEKWQGIKNELDRLFIADKTNGITIEDISNIS